MIKNLCLVFMLGIMPLQSIWADEAEDMWWAIIERDLAQVKSLVEKGVSVNIKTDGLMFASMWGELEIVKYLVSKGAYINAVVTIDMYSMTALDIAEITENYDIAEFLRKAGVKSLFNVSGAEFAKMREVFQSQSFIARRIDAQVATARADSALTMKAIVAEVFANNINTKSPKAPKGESWGKWIIEIGELDTDRWAVSSNGIYLKDCNNKISLIWINPKTGDMHFNPSKLNGDNEFCKALKESYTFGENNGDRVISLDSDKVKF